RTALLESKNGLPTKRLRLEGIGRFYRNGHPELAAIDHSGEMTMMTVDVQITRPTKFNAALVFKTSKLITSFPTLPNADLILAVIDQQQAELSAGSSNSSSPSTTKDPVDVISTSVAASGTSSGTSGSKFGPPSLIVADPYHITSG